MEGGGSNGQDVWRYIIIIYYSFVLTHNSGLTAIIEISINPNNAPRENLAIIPMAHCEKFLNWQLDNVGSYIFINPVNYFENSIKFHLYIICVCNARAPKNAIASETILWASSGGPKTIIHRYTFESGDFCFAVFQSHQQFSSNAFNDNVVKIPFKLLRLHEVYGAVPV